MGAIGKSANIVLIAFAKRFIFQVFDNLLYSEADCMRRTVLAYA